MKPITRTKGVRGRLNEPHGTTALCAWLVAEEDTNQTVRIQTRSPQYVKGFAQLGRGRDKPKLTAHGCGHGFLKVFELRMAFADALAFVKGQLERPLLQVV